MKKIYMIEEVYCSCEEYDIWAYEIRTDYGFFTTLEDAKEFMRVKDLPSLFASDTGEGFRPVEILENLNEPRKIEEV